MLYNNLIFLFTELNDFEFRLCREFCLILAGNTVLVLIAWKIYGPRISAKFGPSKGSRKTVEELKLSISEFHLPKEHDFKFKWLFFPERRKNPTWSWNCNLHKKPYFLSGGFKYIADKTALNLDKKNSQTKTSSF